MILFKSKQQVLSRTDLNQEHLKIEQHSTNLIGMLLLSRTFLETRESKLSLRR